MTREEIALELTKLAYSGATRENKATGKTQKAEEVITALYNYIFSNLQCGEPSK